MESQRSFLIIGLALVSFLLWQQWQVEYGPQPVQPAPTASVADPLSALPDNAVPSADVVNNNSSVPTDIAAQSTQDVPVSESNALPATQVQSERFINVTTDTLAVTIDLVGGDVVVADLVKFPVTQGSDDSFSLLRADNATLYVAQSGLVGANGPDANPQGRPLYGATSATYTLNGDTLVVPLTWSNEEGLSVTKSFTFARDSHAVDVSYQVTNNTAQTAEISQYAQLKQTMAQPEGNMFMPTYRGAAYSTQDTQYEKFTFGDFEDDNIRISTPGGWVGMLEHYFVFCVGTTTTRNKYTLLTNSV